MKIRLMLRSFFYSVGLLVIVIHVTAQENDSPLFKVGILADVQYSNDENKGTRHYRSSVDKLRKSLARFQKNKVDFIINLGDFIDNDFDSFEPLINMMDQVGIPVYNVLGNHDFAVADNKKKKVPSILGLDKRYYSFTRVNWRFICLDGNDVSLYANKKGSRKHQRAQSILDSLKQVKAPNAYEWNGAVGKKQLTWIKRQLSQAEKAGESVIVLCHFPVFPTSEVENLWNADEIRGLMEKFTGKLVFFHGHTHRSNFNLNNGIYHVSFRGMVEKEENAFSIAEVFSDSIAIKGYGAEKNNTISW